MLAVKHGLDHLAGERLGHEEQCGRCQHHAPAGIDRRRQRNGKEDGDDRTDERHETHEPGEDAPQHGIGDADEPQSRADENSEACVEDGLHQEKAAQP